MIRRLIAAAVAGAGVVAAARTSAVRQWFVGDLDERELDQVREQLVARGTDRILQALSDPALDLCDELDAALERAERAEEIVSRVTALYVLATDFGYIHVDVAALYQALTGPDDSDG